MKFYDGKDYFRILVDCTGGHVLNDTRNYVMLAVVWSAIAVTLEQQVAEKATGEQVDLPSLSGVVFVAGFMLAMQASSAYKRFKAGMDAALELEEQSFELMRHACMIFDTADLAWLRVECRRTLLVVILSLIVDVKTSASHGGAEYKALGMECLRRAADANMLTVQEKQLLFKKKMAPRIFFRVAAREFQSKMIRLLYDEQSEGWRVRWQKEKTNQPMVNFVKTMDGHWKGILGTGSQMILLTEQNFPLCYVQVCTRDLLYYMSHDLQLSRALLCLSRFHAFCGLLSFSFSRSTWHPIWVTSRVSSCVYLWCRIFRWSLSRPTSRIRLDSTTIRLT